MGLGIVISLKTVAPIMILILVGLIVFMRRKQQRSIGYIICFSVFYVYLLYVAEYTIFPIGLFDHSRTLIMIKQGLTWKSGLNLIPFRELSLAYLLSIQGYGNVLLTIPFGFGLPFITTTNFKSIIWKGVLFSVSIEFVQFLINISYLFCYTVRTVDVNDVILNFTGILFGFGLFRLLSWLYRKSISVHESVEGAWEHVHTVLTKGN